ncbi:MAG: efflux RND transporter periplasmic adaptor subunit [Candidatus Coatesbacteria bacterium]|nr:efflux RND transporter periplasmic adaptor subunit [Candidatus Coatesbacteria bacterium]
MIDWTGMMRRRKDGLDAIGAAGMLRRLVLPFLLVTLAIGVIVAVGCGDGDDRLNNGNNNKQTAKVTVKAVPAKLGDIRSTISVTGTTKAAQEAKLGSKVSGRVEKVAVDEGDKVSSGDALVVLEQTDFELAVQEAEAAVKNAEAAVSVAKVSLEKANRDFERFAKLHKQSVISEQSYEDVDTAKSVAEDNLTLARAGLSQAATRLQSAKQRLEDSVIRAPFSGVVVGKMTNEGEYVGPGGQPLVWLMDLSKVKIDIGIPEDYSGKVKVGQSAKVSVDAFDDKSFEGAVITVNPLVDEKSRSFNVQLEIDNTDAEHYLNSGMFARVSIVIGRKEGVVLVPTQALVTIEGKRTLYAVSGSSAHRKDVVVGQQDNGNAEIVSGVSAGELVVTEGNWGLSDGQDVILTQ